VRIAPLDELDELPPPAPLPLVRFCGAKGCRRRARPGGRHCSFCHAQAVRRWREGHRHALAARRRDAATLRNAESRARDSARAKLAVAVRRGTIARGRCVECDAADVVGLIADPARWRDVVWVCREHRETEVQRRQDAEEERAYQAKQALWYDERARVLAEVDLLPPDERARLHALAERGPLGIQLNPGSPMFVMNIVRIYKARL